MKEIKITLKNLTIGKSRDPDNIVCEIFKEGVIGDDLKISVLLMMNKLEKDYYSSRVHENSKHNHVAQKEIEIGS